MRDDKGLNCILTIGIGGGGGLQKYSEGAVRMGNQHWQPPCLPAAQPEDRSRDKQE